jgi:PKD repeat protein
MEVKMYVKKRRCISLRGLAVFFIFTLSAIFSPSQINPFSLANTALAAEPAAFSSWAKTAKLGGAAVFIGMTAQEMDQVISNMVAQNVTVIEADSDLSNYLTDAEFEQELALMRSFAAAAHARGLKVVWYYPSLEVITVNGKNIQQTMAREHPDWVQIGLGGIPNVFYGGSGQVFWVAANDESAWMSPSSPGYRSYFFERVRKIAATGIDGLWVDVPIYADFGPTKWSDFNPDAVAKFQTDTGFTIPVAEDWNDPAWRRWIAWRHEELARFLRDVTAAARSVNPEFPIFAETLPTDYNGATIYGLDGSYLKHIEGLTHVWEVDTMSNNVGMRNALEDDWISFISAYKYTRAASGKKPSWVFSYGKQADDAELVMAQALSTGNNPYELQIPEMTTTVDAGFRSRMFGWAQVNTPYLFEAQTAARVAVLYSSPSRDYVDQAQGLGMFVTWQDGGDSLWWAADPKDSAYERQYLAEFRGVVKMLVHQHIPFESVVNPADSAELLPYETVILPGVQAISDSEAAILRQYVQNGGKLIITGANPTGLDQYGTARAEYALADLLGFSKGGPLPAEKQNTFGAGSVLFYSATLGKNYFVSNDASALQKLSGAIQATSTIPLTTDADRRVHFEMSQLGNQTILQFVNFIGVDGSFTSVPTTFSVNLKISDGKQVTGVAVTAPDLLSMLTLNPLDFTTSNQQVSFNVALNRYALVVVSYSDASSGGGTPTNNPPVATFSTACTDLTCNFTDTSSDSDGSIVAWSWDFGDGTTSSQQSPSHTFAAGGTYPVALTVTDNNGASTTSSQNRTVRPAICSSLPTNSPQYIQMCGICPPLSYPICGNANNPPLAPSVTYYPTNVTVTTGTYDWGTMESLKQADSDTYDILSAAASGGQETDWFATTTISESPGSVAQIKVTHTGQYSQAGVSQSFYMYNFEAQGWELVNTSTVGNEEDVLVSWVIDAGASKYISPQGQLSVRLSGFKAASSFYSWSSALSWEVSQAAGGSGGSSGGGTPVNNSPVAAFSVGCTGLTCNFTDGSSDSDGSITGWNWNFGGGATSSQQNPSYTYAAAGTYPVTLTVTDNNGTSATSSQNVTVSNPPPANPTPAAAVIYYPKNVTVTTGTYDWGTMESFKVVDNDTYDILTAAASGGQGIDWYATTTISESPGSVAQIKVTHSGQYSQAGVSQSFYVYNFQGQVWELVNTSTVGNEEDVSVSWIINADVSKYISAQGELRVRLSGFKAANSFYSWSSALSWAVSQAAGSGG